MNRGMVALVFLAVFLSLVPTHALIETLPIENDDRTAFHIESFGYEANGVFELVVDDFMLMVMHDFVKPPDNAYRIGFVLQRSNSDGGLRIEENTDGSCFHEKLTEEDILFPLNERTTWKHKEFSKKIEIPGYYHLYFSNCMPKTQVSFSLKLTEFNVAADGSKSYLSAGENSLPTWVFLICAIFAVQLAVWVSFLTKQRENIKSIHHLMTVVLMLKICTLFFEAFRYHSLKTTGLHDGWTIAFYIFSFLKGMMMFSVIVLIGTGWSYLKPFLTDRDKSIMLAVLVVQSMVNVSMVILDESSPGSAGWLTWRDVLHLLDMVCCCVILLPIVASIRHLRSAANTDGKVQRNLDRLKSFRTFYLLVVGYVYFTRIIVFLLGATLPFELTWLSTVFAELAAFIFYTTTGYLFRPQSANPYLPVEQDAESAHATEMASV